MLATRRSTWVPAANPKALLVPWSVLRESRPIPAASRSTLNIGDAAIRNCCVIQSRARSALDRAEHLGADDAIRAGVHDEDRTTASQRCSAHPLDGASAGQHLRCAPNASAQPWTR